LSGLDSLQGLVELHIEFIIVPAEGQQESFEPPFYMAEICKNPPCQEMPEMHRPGFLQGLHQGLDDLDSLLLPGLAPKLCRSGVQ